MIRVLIYLNDDETQLSEMHITRTENVSGHLHEYIVEVATDKVETVQFIRRTTYHARAHNNVLALVRAALGALPEEAFLLEGPLPTGPYRRKRNLLGLIRGSK